MSSSKKKILFIVNPISGNRSGESAYTAIMERVNADLFDFDVKTTEYAGHATELTQQAVADGYDIVTAVGGDGTVNEVARSLVHSQTALGIIPVGSGNGLARHLRIPMDKEKAIDIINHCTIHRLDYGLINDRPFFCTCGLGFDAFVSHKFAQSGKRGLNTYLEKTLMEGLTYKPETYIIESEDGKVQYEAFLVACANASQYGNNAFIAPEASMKDGLLDIIIMKPFTAFEAPQIAFQLFNRNLHHNSHIVAFRAEKVKITRQKAGPAHFDGDPMMTDKEVEVKLVKRAINIVVNSTPSQMQEKPLQGLFDFFTELPNPFGDNLLKSSKKIINLDNNILYRLRKNK